MSQAPLPLTIDWDHWPLPEEDEDRSTKGFEIVLGQRDKFFGSPSCVVCGMTMVVEYCYIIPRDEELTWKDLKSRNWIPQVTQRLADEPRNGMVMCPNHRVEFNTYQFLIRFSPETEKFIFVNYSGYSMYEPYHGKAIALDKNDPSVPFPSLFVIHEWRVRGCHPFKSPEPYIPADSNITLQDWIMLDNNSVFDRDSPHPADFGLRRPLLARSTRKLPNLSDDVVGKILATTHTLPTWEACKLGNESWVGTADENTKKYLDKSGGGLEGSV